MVNAATSVAPEAGFSARVDGTDGVLYYVNICSHPAVDRPIDAKDRPVSDEHINSLGIDNLRVPLLTGPVRIIGMDGSGAEEATVMDVVFNPSVVTPALQQDEAAAETDPRARLRVSLARALRGRLVELAMKNFEEELGTKVGRALKLPRGLAYKGGTGTGGQKPLPMTALRQLKQVAEADARQRELQAAPGPWRSNREAVGLQNRQPPPLVQELGSANASQDSAASGTVKGKPAVKKGFLNGAKTQLYPNGSTEGTPPPGAGDPLGWMPPKLRSRVAMVDTGSTSVEQQRAMMEAHAAPRSTPKAASNKPALPAELADEVQRIADVTDPQTFLKEMQTLSEALPTTGVRPAHHTGPTGQAAAASATTVSTTVLPLGKSLESSCGAGVARGEAVETLSGTASSKAASGEPAAQTVRHELTEEQDGVSLRIPLSGVTSMSEVDADISDEGFILTGAGASLELRWPRKVNADQARARFLKKSGTLLVTAPYGVLV